MKFSNDFLRSEYDYSDLKFDTSSLSNKRFSYTHSGAQDDSKDYFGRQNVDSIKETGGRCQPSSFKHLNSPRTAKELRLSNGRNSELKPLDRGEQSKAKGVKKNEGESSCKFLAGNCDSGRQKSQITRARKSVAGFKLREGQEIGCRVTLRGTRMYEFLERLISLALPRVRDFRGVNPKAFDGAGNYSLGLNEQVVFLEIDPDSVHHAQGMNITIVTTAKDNDEGRLLLTELGMPFRK